MPGTGRPRSPFVAICSAMPAQSALERSDPGNRALIFLVAHPVVGECFGPKPLPDALQDFRISAFYREGDAPFPTSHEVNVSESSQHCPLLDANSISTYGFGDFLIYVHVFPPNRFVNASLNYAAGSITDLNQ